MSARKTVVSAVVFLALLGLYLVDTKRVARREVQKERSERLFPFELEQIQHVALHNANGDFVLEQTSGEGWRLTQPMETAADREAVEPMLRNLAGAKKRNVFTPGNDITQYGLKDPKVWVEVRGTEEGKSRTVKILFGDTAAQTYQVYGQIDGEQEAFTISDYSMKQCEKTLFQLRDKTLLAAAPEIVTGLEITTGGRSLRVQRPSAESEKWMLDPSGMEADRQAVDNLLRTIHNTKATRILDSPTTPAAMLGTTPQTAQAVVRVTRAPASPGAPTTLTIPQTAPTTPTQTLSVGRKTSEGDGLYCQVENNPRLFVVRETFLSDLNKDPRELRDKRILDVAQGDVARIAIRSSSKSAEVARKTQEGEWEFADGEPGRVSQQKVSRLLGDLTLLQAKDFIADTTDTTALRQNKWGLEEPRVEVRLATFDQPTTHGFDVGETNTDAGVVYLRRLSDGAVLALDFKRLGDFYKFHDDLEDRTFLRVDPETVSRVRIELQAAQGPVTYEFSQRKSSWAAQTSTGKNVTVQPFDVREFLRDLVELEYADRYTPEPGDDTHGGLANPTIRITLLGAAGKEMGQLSMGSRRGFRQIMGTGSEAYVVDLTNTDRMTRGLEKLLTRVEQTPPEDLLGGGKAESKP